VDIFTGTQCRSSGATNIDLTVRKIRRRKLTDEFDWHWCNWTSVTYCYEVPLTYLLTDRVRS